MIYCRPEAKRGKSETREEKQVNHPEECLVAVSNLWYQVGTGKWDRVQKVWPQEFFVDLD